MMELTGLAEERDVLKPFGEVDVLPLYAIVSSELVTFLGDREIASRVWLKQRTPLNRGSQLPPLRVDEISRRVSPDLLQLRAKITLAEARGSLRPVEEKIWRYFPPKRLCDYFYATNHEGQGREIERVFYDIDRPKDMAYEKAREVTHLFLEAVLNDDQFRQFLTGRPLVAWTGSSFHVYLFLKQKQKHDFYDQAIQYTEKIRDKGFTAKWLKYVSQRTQVNVIGGHEKKPGSITVDPSQTPSGKLARSPLGSFHMSDYETVDGVSIPIEISRLNDPNLTDSLREYTPKQLIREISQFSEILSL